jgi:hypothetical protein
LTASSSLSRAVRGRRCLWITRRDGPVLLLGAHAAPLVPRES